VIYADSKDKNIVLSYLRNKIVENILKRADYEDRKYLIFQEARYEQGVIYRYVKKLCKTIVYSDNLPELSEPVEKALINDITWFLHKTFYENRSKYIKKTVDNY
jgi:hypothetical protein